MPSLSPELASSYVKENITFLDHQLLLAPSVNEQIGFDFQGLRRSYAGDPKHPDSRFIARFGRIWIYDVALSIYADLKAKRLRSAGYQAGRIMQVALREEERGFQGLWHFSYNTQGDDFIDPRGPTGANTWCLGALYAFLLTTGNTALLTWANRIVKEYLFRQQVMDFEDPRYGLIRAGLYNLEDFGRGDAMGYRVYEGNPNFPYEHIILEHNAAAASAFRLAFRATKRFALKEKSFLEELNHRHDLLMRGIRRCFWRGDHFVSAMDGKGKLFTGTDGLPSVAVDNNTWAAHVYLPYDLELAQAAIRYVEKKFLTQAPPAKTEDLPAPPVSEELEGLYYFPATFVDPFVPVAQEDRAKMEQLLQPEAAFGFILFLHSTASHLTQEDQRQRIQARALELYEQTVQLSRLYGPSGAPYASANVPKVFTTLPSVTTAASGVIATAILLKGAPSDDFIGVIPPAEFRVEGRSPSVSAP